MSLSKTQFPSFEPYPDHEKSTQEERSSMDRFFRWLLAYTALAAGIVALMLLSLIPTERHVAKIAKVDQERFSSFRTAGVAQ